MKTVNGSALIAAERRRRIMDLMLERGSAAVSELAALLGVAENTIRNDLARLHQQGKLLRSHGGAVVRETGIPVPPYSQVRDQRMLEKSWIAEAAISLMPKSGSVYINPGSTTFQLVQRLEADYQVETTTNSPEIALYLSSNTAADVNLVGGRIIRESLETDGTFSGEIDRLYYDVAFMGITAVDTDHGITSISLVCAALDRKAMEHSRKVVGLCDSSKLGRYSRAQLGPATLVDVLITDRDAPSSIVDSLREQSLEVIIAGPGTDKDANGPR